VISAVGADGTLVFDVFQGTCDELRFMDFLDKLLAHFPEREKIFLILDNAKFHKSAAIELWLLDHPRMELFFLPPYAPELNPDELLKPGRPRARRSPPPPGPRDADQDDRRVPCDPDTRDRPQLLQGRSRVIRPVTSALFARHRDITASHK